jgi:polysaccharide biosynthesis/export protein
MMTSTCMKFLGFVFTILLFASCDPSKRINRDYLYFQNDRDIVVKTKIEEVTIKPKDLLNIQIFSNTLNQEQAAPYNIGGQQGYIVSLDGKIQLPGQGLGEMVVAGQTRDQLQKNIRMKLLPYVKEPVVTVRIQNFTINVLGEVGAAGTKTFPTDQVTILDAIGASGDLLPTGRRDNVTVIRETNGVKQIHEIDLRSAALFESPVYQLQQNDIVYVNANNTKLKAVKEQKTNIGTIAQYGATIIGIVTSLYFLFRNN